MRSLWIRLMGAFILVIFLYGLVDTFLVHQATQEQFKLYTSQTGLAWAESLAPSLEEYYAESGGWHGVGNVFGSPSPGNMPSMMGGGMMGGEMHSEMMGSENIWGMMGFQLVLADVDGWVQADTSDTLIGMQLPEADLSAGVPLMWKEAQVGTLLVLDTILVPDSASNNFVRTLSTATWQSSLLAALFALVIGSLLFRQIISPIRSITEAAKKIAAGDLDQRVPEKSSDEVGQMAQTFNQMADALEHDRRLRRNMTADISHELRTPLSIIQGNLEAMMDGVLPSTPQEIASLHDETLLLSRLIEDLHMLSIAEAGQLHLELVETDILALLEQTVSTMRPAAEGLGIKLEAFLPDSVPMLKLDHDRINQILQNLISNALRYTPSGGTISVSAEHNSQAVFIELSDTGGGIAAEDIPHIFDRFFRGEKSRNRSSGGSGIGLAIVRQLMQAQGGHVDVKSPIHSRDDGTGYGTCFKLTLPVA